jgi:hypothetical protein
LSTELLAVPIYAKVSDNSAQPGCEGSSSYALEFPQALGPLVEELVADKLEAIGGVV